MNDDTISIEREIESARNMLGRQLSEVEEKAKDAMDWRSHYRRNPIPMLAAAAAAGFVISGWLGGDEHDDSGVSPAHPRRMMALKSPAMNQTMDTMMDALIAAASAKAAEYIEDWIPGFHQEFTRRKG